jgi:hypothetical protein
MRELRLGLHTSGIDYVPLAYHRRDKLVITMPWWHIRAKVLCRNLHGTGGNVVAGPQFLGQIDLVQVIDDPDGVTAPTPPVIQQGGK